MVVKVHRPVAIAQPRKLPAVMANIGMQKLSGVQDRRLIKARKIASRTWTKKPANTIQRDKEVSSKGAKESVEGAKKRIREGTEKDEKT